MRALKLIAQILGVAFMLAGGLFALQGLDVVRWPASSSMLADQTWAVNGTIIALVGVLLFWWGSRRRR